MNRSTKSALSISAVTATVVSILTMGVTGPNTASASLFYFAVDASVPNLFTANTLRITGQPSSGSVNLSCGFVGTGTFSIQNAVVIRPPDAALTIEIVPFVLEPLPPGTEIKNPDLVTTCGDFKVYEANIQE